MISCVTNFGRLLVNMFSHIQIFNSKKHKMKKLSMLILAAIVCSTVTIAQDSTKTSHSSTTMHHKMGHGNMKMKDCVMMKDNKMMVMKGGETTAMSSDMTLTNGAKVGADGMLTKSDGTTKQLKNGDCVFMDGKMKHEGMHKKSSSRKTETTTTTQ